MLLAAAIAALALTAGTAVVSAPPAQAYGNALSGVYSGQSAKTRQKCMNGLTEMVSLYYRMQYDVKVLKKCTTNSRGSTEYIIQIRK